MEQRFKRSAETDQMVKYLREFDKNSQVPYSDLSKLISAKIVARSPKLIHARRILLRDHNAVWVCIAPGVGVRRLNDLEIAERLQPYWLRGARNKLKRGGNEIDVVDSSQFNLDQLARFGVDSVQRELALNSLSLATKRKIERVARGTSNDLPAFNIVEWAINLSAPRASKAGGK